MNKSELIDAVAAKTQQSRSATGETLTALIDVITDAMKSGDSVTLIGFGTFHVKERAAREGRNPSTGKPISIAAAKVPGFKAGKALKDALS